jgi:hypothetical protein
VLLTLATGFSLYLFGGTFELGARSYSSFGAAFWVAPAVALTISVGGVLAVAGGRFARPSGGYSSPGSLADIEAQLVKRRSVSRSRK